MAQRGVRAKIDLGELEKLCAMQATDEEIGAFFGVSARTILRRKRAKKFAAIMERGRAKGRISVRRAQMKMLDAGNATMGVWLGKQLLGQTDQVWHEVNQNHNCIIGMSTLTLTQIASETMAEGGESAATTPLALPAPRR
jgi:hypothetical protein